MSRVVCIPYKGSKAKIAEEIIQILPPRKAFYDLFAGGGALTTAALQSRKYSRFVMNDITPGLTQFYIDAIRGKYHNEDRWISREEFDARKFDDAYIRYIWSFGNNGRDYLFSKEIEQYKKAAHYAVMFQTTRLSVN